MKPILLLCVFLSIGACRRNETSLEAAKQRARLAADRKVELVMRQLASDCALSLQKETYTRVQSLRRQAAKRPASRSYRTSGSGSR